jgi:membrane protein YqaA with SNARE-associated domain
MEEEGKLKFWDYLRKNHRSNRDKGVYGYMWWTAVKIVAIYLVTIVPLLIILKRYVDLSSVFGFIVNNLSDPFVLIVFIISESFLGMIPPDFFVIWTAKFNAPFLFLTLLGILSYVGGILSYYIGSWLSKRKRIREYSERVLDKYIKMTRKWGGAFIVIAALFPYSPFSMVVIAVSLLKYPFKLYLLFGLSRIIRFLVQGIFYLHIFNFDKLIG